MLSRRRILVSVLLATVTWELVVAFLAAPYLKAHCFGWCWPLRFAYAVPILVLPAVAQRVTTPADRILVALLALVATAGAAYFTLLGIWIFQSRDWFDVRALGITALLILPQLLALPIILGVVVVVVIAVRATRRNSTPLEEGDARRPDTRARPTQNDPV